MTEISHVPTKMICAEHGAVGPAYICRHLHRGTKRGFFSMIDSDDPHAKQGQCFRCGMVSLIIGSIPLVGYRLWVWYSRPILICAECFEEIRVKNLR